MDDFGFALDDADLFSALMENTADSIYFKDRKCRLIRVSSKMADTLGVKNPSELIGKTDEELFGVEFGAQTRSDDLRVMETGQAIIGLVEANHLPNGDVNWTSTTKLPVRNKTGEIIGLLGITREINDLKKTEIELEFIATHDLLTSLPNRYLFFGQLQQMINRSHRHPHQSAVLYLDLDHFKEVNDQRGHDAGDMVLKQVAELLQSVVREDDLVARLGGDEFIILLEEVQGRSDAAVVAERILHEFGQVFCDGPCLTPSIGISLYPEDSDDAQKLIKRADQAMYEAKKKGNTYFFSIL